jgi:hypothetical protein
MPDRLAPRCLRGAVGAVGLAASAAALAGRPLAVDDANTNEAGAGHVEMWWLHTPRVSAPAIAPAYAPLDGLEFSATLARDTDADVRIGIVQVKWIVTPHQEQGCNVGTTLGNVHSGGGGGNAPYVNGLLTCNAGAQGSLHLNLGAIRPADESWNPVWGLAVERGFGALTADLEFFGSRGSKPVTQVGLRGPIARDWQLDGSIGARDGRALYSVGLKVQY